jgi:hypothetical protein
LIEVFDRSAVIEAGTEAGLKCLNELQQFPLLLLLLARGSG